MTGIKSKEKYILVPTPHEMRWAFEGAASQIEESITLSDVRKDQPKYAHIQPGQIIEANCDKDGRKVPIVVLSVLVGPIAHFSIPLLTVDGFFSHEQALMRMQDFYNDFTKDTPARLTLFITLERFKKLNPSQKDNLYKHMYHPELMFTTQNLREIFFPSLASWISYFNGTGEDWFRYLTEHSLATKESLKKARAEIKRLFKEENKNNPSRSVSEEFAEAVILKDVNSLSIILENKESNPYYHPLILLQPTPIPH